MKKKSKSLIYILGLFISMNIFISAVSADIAIPPCEPGQSPSKDFCSNSSTNNKDNISDNNQMIIYSIAGGLIVIITVISGIVLIKIRRKNVN